MLRICILILYFSIIGGCSDNNESVLSKQGVTKKSEVTFDFKGVRLGQSPDEVNKIFVGKYSNTINPNYYVVCQESRTIASKCDEIKGLTIANRTPKEVTLLFKDNKLSILKIVFNEDYFEEVGNALRKKYGEPTDEVHAPLSNKFTGAGSEYTGLSWENSRGDSIYLTNHDIDGSSYTPKGTFMMAIKPTKTGVEAPPDV